MLLSPVRILKHSSSSLFLFFNLICHLEKVRAVFLKPEFVLELPGEFVKTQISRPQPQMF